MEKYKSVRSILYCEAKRGTVDISDGDTKAMHISECTSFEELKILLTIFETADNGHVNEHTLSTAASYLNLEFPVLDRLLRWPWDAEYEPRV